MALDGYAAQQMKNLRKIQIFIGRLVHKLNFDDDSLFLGLTLMVGVGAGVLAATLKKTIDYLSHLTHASGPNWQSYFIGASFVLVSAWITIKIPSTSGSGLPDLKISLVVHRGVIKLKDWLAKFVTSILSLSSGLVLGREGPTIAITSGLGSTIGRMFSLSQNKVKTLVTVGAAGGMAAAFNTPIAAVTFALEEVQGNLSSKSLGPIIVSAVAASVTAKVLFGGDSLFSILHYEFEDPMELPYFLLVGIVCAFLGPLWTKILLNYRKNIAPYLKRYKLLIVFLSYSLVILTSVFIPGVLGGGDDVINEALLSNHLNWKIVFSLLVTKFFLTIICFSSGISGGIFMPILFMGSMTGVLVGLGAQILSSPSIEIGAFALIGMGAFFAAVIKAPFTSILIIFELTQDYKIILPLMLANISAYIISQKFYKASIYELISEQNGVHLPSKDDHEIMEQITVTDAMVKEVVTLQADQTILSALEQVNHSEISGYPVMKNGLIHGIITSNEIGQAYARGESEKCLTDICVKKIITIYPDQSLMAAFHYLKKYRIERLLVVSRINDHRLVGIITAEDIVNCFGFHIQEESKYDVIDNYINQVAAKTDKVSQE